MKNTLKKSIMLTFRTDFALISTHVIRLGCNFTWNTTMHMTFFRILLTNLQKCFLKYLLRLEVKLSLFFWDFCLDLLWSKTFIFYKHFWRLVNKIWKNLMCIVVLHVKIQTQRTICVEMRTKSIWWVKIIDFFNVFFIFFNFWSNLKANKKPN